MADSAQVSEPRPVEGEGLEGQGGDVLLGSDADSASSFLDHLMDEVGVEETWQLLEEMHASVDRMFDAGELEACRVRELRDRLLELSRRVARRSIREETRSYQRLLRDVSHDIRSPLHSIIFLAEALHSNRDGQLGEARRRQLGTIYAAGTSLLNLVNDVLDYARMEAGEANEVAELAFTVSSVLSDVRQLMGPLVQHYDTEFIVRCETEGRHVGDPQLLCRILTNLVSNGVEAAGRGGGVAVRIAAMDGGLRLQVFDSGSDADVEKLRALVSMEDESSLEVASREKLSGRTHGLGLIICGRLVRATGGWITVEAGSPGSEGLASMSSGTLFTIWLPFPAEEPAAGDARSSASA